MISRRLAVTLGFSATVMLSGPLAAWDSVGHRVVAQIAWQQLDPAIQQRANSLLEQMPADAGLAEMSATATEEDRPRQRFLDGSVWSDVVRDDRFPERRQRYHRGRWHYINHFWDQPAGGEPRLRDDLQPPAENIVHQLGVLRATLATGESAAAEQAVALAWVLHLVGDVHQPLHTTARVTATEPEGDRGGNLFELRRFNNLHRYWDGILRLEYPRDSVEEIARRISTRHPRSSLALALAVQQPEEWSEEGLTLTMAQVYPASLERGRRPNRAYRKQTLEAAQRRIAVAGNRLADLLNAAFADGSKTPSEPLSR